MGQKHASISRQSKLVLIMARAFLNQELVRKSRRSGFIFVLAARSSLSAVLRRPARHFGRGYFLSVPRWFATGQVIRESFLKSASAVGISALRARESA